MNDLRLLTKQNHLTLLITKESTSLESDFNIFQDFTLFLIKYAFVLTDSIQDTNSSKPQFPPPGELFSQNPNGARYLDPKYSRWISTDPALGEYVPLAPVNDEAKKHNQNLPGMGGLFNTVNLSLYHYAGNNPIKYVDPDGRDWLCRTVDGIQEYFYRDDITSTAQAKKEYGKSAFVLFNGYEVNGFRFYNNNGKPYMTDSSGNRINRSKPIQGSDFDIFPGSASCTGVDPDTLHKNLFGTSYTGSHNPMEYFDPNKQDADPVPSFAYTPRNKSEFGSIIHDVEYGKNGVSGITGAFFATSVKDADLNLSYFNYLNMHADVGIADKLRSAGTTFLFGIIGTEKYMTDAFFDYNTKNALNYLNMRNFVVNELQKLDQGGGHGF